jgi:RHS repeat-associated protein
MEKDDEVMGVGNSYDFVNRIYDPRIGKFLSVDPIANEFSGLSPYIFANNSPIQHIDFEGLNGIRPPRRANTTKLNNRPPQSTRELTKYNPISRNNLMKITLFEPSTGATGPIITRGNLPGQRVALLTDLSEVTLTRIKERRFSQVNGSVMTNNKEYYKIQFLNPQTQKEYNKLQQQYDDSFNEAVGNLPKVGPIDSYGSIQNYNVDQARFNLQVQMIKNELGLSPYEQIINQIKNNTNANETQTQRVVIPEIRQGRN